MLAHAHDTHTYARTHVPHIPTSTQAHMCNAHVQSTNMHIRAPHLDDLANAEVHLAHQWTCTTRVCPWQRIPRANLQTTHSHLHPTSPHTQTATTVRASIVHVSQTRYIRHPDWPFGPCPQLPSDPAEMHVSTALLSSGPDSGVKDDAAAKGDCVVLGTNFVEA